MMPKKIEGLKKFCLLLDDSELEQAKKMAVNRDVTTISIIGNTSKFIRYLIQQFIKGV